MEGGRCPGGTCPRLISYMSDMHIIYMSDMLIMKWLIFCFLVYSYMVKVL